MGEHKSPSQQTYGLSSDVKSTGFCLEIVKSEQQGEWMIPIVRPDKKGHEQGKP